MSEQPMHDQPEAPCGECGRPTNRVYVPVGDLRELIQRWGQRHDDEITMMEKAAWGTARHELHQLIQEYE